MVAPVLQELRRELYGVPRHLVDPGEVDVDCGQHVLQAVAELVEQRDNLEQPATNTTEVVRRVRGAGACAGFVTAVSCLSSCADRHHQAQRREP